MAFGLPVNIRSLFALVGDVEAEGVMPLQLELLVDKTVSPAGLAAAREAFKPIAAGLTVLPLAYGQSDGGAAQPGSSDVADGGEVRARIPGAPDAGPGVPELADTADLTVIIAGSSPTTAMCMLSAALKQRPVVILSEDAQALQAAWPSAYGIEIDAGSLVAMSREQLARHGYSGLYQNLAQWVIEKLPDQALAWARSLAFIRPVYSQEAISSTALVNGAVAAAVFLPGADMPILLFNQARMLIRLMSAEGLPPDVSQWRQLAALVAALAGAGFAWRGLARQLVKWTPAWGWAVKATIGYSGTWLAGQAALAYLTAAQARPGKAAALLDSNPAHPSSPAVESNPASLTQPASTSRPSSPPALSESPSD